MSPLTSYLLRRAVATIAVIAAFNVAADRASATGFATCPAKAGELAASPLASVWLERGRLMSCSTVGGRDPQIRQLGRWSTQGHLSLSDATVGWTQRVGGVDRVFAADLASFAKDPRFVKGGLPTSGRSRGAHGRVVGLETRGRAVAWITKSGLLSVALPQRRVELGRRLAGSSAHETLAALRVELVSSEGDECAAVGEFAVSAPVAGPTADVTIASRFVPGAPGC